jgi:hypothetical protein
MVHGMVGGILDAPSARQVLDCRTWSVISGGQLKRTGTIEQPKPTEVYPFMSRYVQEPEPM